MKTTGFTFANDEYTLRVLPYSGKIVRVTYGKEELFPRDSMIVTLQPPEKVDAEYDDRDGSAVIKTDFLSLIIDKETLAVKYFRDGQLLSSESESAPRTLEKYDIYRAVGGVVSERVTVDGVRSSMSGGGRELTGSAYHASVSVTFADDEVVLGLGSHEEGYPDIRGRFIPLYQENMRIAVPYFVSSAGYAYLFDCTSMMTFDDRGGRGVVYLDSVDAVDYYFIAGVDFDDVCRGYRTLTGATPMLPKYAVGYAQSKERYTCSDELVDVVAEYRKRGVPLDIIVQDWQYWRGSSWGDKVFDKSRYPDVSALTDALHKMGAHMMVSIWPNMSGDSENRREFENAGKLLGDGSVYDAFDEEARRIYWRQANDGIYSHGTDAWWCDSTEPFDAVWHGHERSELDERMKMSVGEFKKYLSDKIINAYSLAHSRGIYEGQRAVGDGKRVLNLTRSGYSGQHRYGTVVWSGDVSASWETLRRQVNIAQNYIACGEAYWNCDIGAFFVKKGYPWFCNGDYDGGCADDGYRELYTRWAQFAAFTPMMRSHGTDTPREIWRFGEPGGRYYDAIEKAIRLRYSLVPYFYSVNAAVTFDGTMPIRALALAFPDDENARGADGEYMYGHEFLVCPVTTPESENGGTVEVYLPRGGWYDYYTEQYYDGGRTVKAAAPIDRIPLFVRAGSIIPTVEVMQYVDEVKNAPYEVVIYGGADGEFTLYDDSGDSYEYENGEYAMTHIRYNDADGAVTESLTGKMQYRHAVTYRIVK